MRTCLKIISVWNLLQWKSICLACASTWVQSPVLKGKKGEHYPHRMECANLIILRRKRKRDRERQRWKEREEDTEKEIDRDREKCEYA